MNNVDGIKYCICYCGRKNCLKNRIHIKKNKKIEWDDFFVCEWHQKLTEKQAEVYFKDFDAMNSEGQKFETNYEAIWIGGKP